MLSHRTLGECLDFVCPWYFHIVDTFALSVKLRSRISLSPSSVLERERENSYISDHHLCTYMGSACDLLYYFNYHCSILLLSVVTKELIQLPVRLMEGFPLAPLGAGSDSKSLTIVVIGA